MVSRSWLTGRGCRIHYHTGYSLLTFHIKGWLFLSFLSSHTSFFSFVDKTTSIPTPRKRKRACISAVAPSFILYVNERAGRKSNRHIIRVPSRGGFGGLNPHQNHLDPHFIWPWVQWTLCIDLSQAVSNFSYAILKSLVCWWPHSSFVLYNVIRKYNICSRIKCQLVTCAQHDPASTPERVGLLLQMKTK